MQSMNTDIAARAYQIWEEEGRPHGKDQEHWNRATAELSKPAAAPKAKAAAAKTAPAKTAAAVEAPVAKPKKTTAVKTAPVKAKK